MTNAHFLFIVNLFRAANNQKPLKAIESRAKAIAYIDNPELIEAAESINPEDDFYWETQVTRIVNDQLGASADAPEDDDTPLADNPSADAPTASAADFITTADLARQLNVNPKVLRARVRRNREVFAHFLVAPHKFDASRIDELTALLTA